VWIHLPYRPLARGTAYGESRRGVRVGGRRAVARLAPLGRRPLFSAAGFSGFRAAISWRHALSRRPSRELVVQRALNLGVVSTQASSPRSTVTALPPRMTRAPATRTRRTPPRADV